MVALAEIAPHPANFRNRLRDLDELATSIGRQGLVRPLEVMPADRVAAAWPEHAEALAGYAWVLLSGHRRLAAYRAFVNDPQAQVPVLIHSGGICDDAGQQLDVMTTEEIAHRPWNPIEQARAFDAARATGRTQVEIAERYGCSQSYVAQRLSLLRLPVEIQQAVERRDLAVRDGLKLARLGDMDRMREVWELYTNRREDAWIRTIDQAITQQAGRVDYQTRRRAALAVAEAEGVPVVDPVERFGRDLQAHRVVGPDMETARDAGTLVAAVSGLGDLEYYTTTVLRPEPDAGTGAPDQRERRAAAAARERAGRRLAARRPWQLSPQAAGPIDAFLRTAPQGWRPIARRWLRQLGVGPAGVVDPDRWWEAIYSAEWDTRVWAAHCLALAGPEHRVRTNQEWERADVAWLRRLVDDCGYVPRRWERQRLEADGYEELASGLPVEPPAGWFADYERCPAFVGLSGVDMAWLERDPEHLHVVFQHNQCRLEEEHPGAHAAEVQSARAEYYDFEQQTGALHLWAWWHDVLDDYRIVPAELCAETRANTDPDPGCAPEPVSCCLPDGHPGRHYS